MKDPLRMFYFCHHITVLLLSTLSVVLWENLIISVGLQLFFVEIAAWKILIVLSNLTFPALAFCLIKMLLSLWSWLVTTRVLCNYSNYIRLKLMLINPLPSPHQSNTTAQTSSQWPSIIFLKQSYSIHEIKVDFFLSWRSPLKVWYYNTKARTLIELVTCH